MGDQSMTEDEAKQKWCPMASSGRLLTKAEFGESCIASRCMAWRWKETVEHGPALTERGVVFIDGTVTSTTHGHCGLAR